MCTRCPRGLLLHTVPKRTIGFDRTWSLSGIFAGHPILRGYRRPQPDNSLNSLEGLVICNTSLQIVNVSGDMHLGQV